VKLMHRPGKYEELLALSQAKAFRAARESMSRPGPRADAVPDSGEPQPQARSLQDIWRRSEPPPAPPVPPAHPPTIPAPVHVPTDTAEHRTPDDTALRRMNDSPTPHEAPRPTGGGIELYSEDDDDF
jgi:hypothetical protein